MGELWPAVYGTCCGVGYVTVCAFLAVVLVFLLVSLIGACAEALAKVLPAQPARVPFSKSV